MKKISLNSQHAHHRNNASYQFNSTITYMINIRLELQLLQTSILYSSSK